MLRRPVFFSSTNDECSRDRRNEHRQQQCIGRRHRCCIDINVVSVDVVDTASARRPPRAGTGQSDVRIEPDDCNIATDFKSINYFFFSAHKEIQLRVAATLRADELERELQAHGEQEKKLQIWRKFEFWLIFCARSGTGCAAGRCQSDAGSTDGAIGRCAFRRGKNQFFFSSFFLKLCLVDLSGSSRVASARCRALRVDRGRRATATECDKRKRKRKKKTIHVVKNRTHAVF